MYEPPQGGARLWAPMPPETPAADPLTEVTRTLEPAYRLDNLVALSRERALYQAWDRLLKRPVAIRVHLVPGTQEWQAFARWWGTFGG